MKRILLLALLTVSCASHIPPATLSGVGVSAWYANEAVVAIGTLQHVAIELNKVIICDAPTATSNAIPSCHPILSDANTRVVVDSVTVALNTMRAVPSGWVQTTVTALDQISNKLDQYGQVKLRPYLDAARIVIGNFR